ncbi:Gp49 family protein [Delftia acidovorans]|mgnify:CR=1 FL=1|uniref:Gp49 family protein n=1 Tax=Delftia acidovorans TaxID=80866 RepID=UPI002FDCC55F
MTQHTCGSACSHASDCAVHNEPAMPAGPCDCSVEAEIQAKGKTAPSVTPDDIQREIIGEYFFTAFDGVAGAGYNEVSPDGVLRPFTFKAPGSLGLLTFCVLLLRNGFTVTGESACASPENFDAAIGRKIARQNAEQKIWPLLGFRLRDQLAARGAQ